MFSPECSARCCLGNPLIAVHALRSLRDLLSSLQSQKDCGKASTNPPLQEVVSEEANRAAGFTVQPAVAERSGSRYPECKQRELALALIELLISGFRDASPTAGGGDVPEADR
jgi:hypothetical protein